MYLQDYLSNNQSLPDTKLSASSLIKEQQTNKKSEEIPFLRVQITQKTFNTDPAEKTSLVTCVIIATSLDITFIW